MGVELEEAKGKNDGSVNEVRYFTCQPNFGLFTKESQVGMWVSGLQIRYRGRIPILGGGLYEANGGDRRHIISVVFSCAVIMSRSGI